MNHLFIHIPKTAGLSIYKALNEKIGMTQYLNPGEFSGEGHATFGHISIKSLIQEGIITGEYWKDCNPFTVVRNPYNRSVSLWKYFTASRKLTLETTLFQFLSSISVQDCRPGYYNVYNFNQCAPQVDWIVNGTKIYRFTNLKELENDFDIELEHINKGRTIEQDHMDYHDERTINLVNMIYRKDFVMLGYTMINP